MTAPSTLLMSAPGAAVLYGVLHYSSTCAYELCLQVSLHRILIHQKRSCKNCGLGACIHLGAVLNSLLAHLSVLHSLAARML